MERVLSLFPRLITACPATDSGTFATNRRDGSFNFQLTGLGRLSPRAGIADVRRGAA